MPENQELKEKVEKLSGDIAGLTTSFTAVELFAQETDKASKKASDANRTALGVSIGLVILLILGVWLVERQQDNRQRSELTEQYLTDACNNGNVSRSKEAALWDFLLTASAKEPQNQTKENKALLAKLEGLADEAYGQRDCSQVKNGQLGVITPAPLAPS